MQNLQFFFIEEEVKNAAHELHEIFYDMVSCTENALQSSKADPRSLVNLIHHRDVHFTPLPKKFSKSLEGAPDVIGLFSKFNDFWDPFNYFILERLLLQRATRQLFNEDLVRVYDELHECMLQYKTHMEYFRKHTEVKVYCSSVLIHNEKKKVPDGFKELVQKRDLKTLEDVEKFRKEVASKYKLSKCLVFLKKIVYGSVILTFWIPICATIPGIGLDTGDFGSDSITVEDGAEVLQSTHKSK